MSDSRSDKAGMHDVVAIPLSVDAPHAPFMEAVCDYRIFVNMLQGAGAKFHSYSSVKRGTTFHHILVDEFNSEGYSGFMALMTFNSVGGLYGVGGVE